MSFLFGKGKGKSNDVVKATKEALNALNKDKAKVEKVSEEVSKNLILMKQVFYGDGEAEPNQEQITQLANDIYGADLIPLLITNMSKLEFEAKKDLVTVFNFLLRRQVGARSPTVEYIARNPSILQSLISGYEITDITLNCGAMLRECVRHVSLATIVLESDNFYLFFDYVELPNFDIASDAFATFKDILSIHKKEVAEFFEQNYDKFFEKYTNLLHSENYVTKRQSLKLLGELLLDKANFGIMTKYISHSSNLKLMMNLLRDKSKSIQFEAFHVFKVFVANPNKPETISEILIKNKDKLLKFLSKFHNDRDDEQFNDEKQYLIRQIEQL